MNWNTNIILFGFMGVLSLNACEEDEILNEVYDDTPYTIEEVYRYPEVELPVENPLTQAKVDLGRKLFYDTQLSRSKNMSCATCHNQAFSFTDNGLALSTNDIGNPTLRNATPLINLAWTDKGFFWDGRVMTLEEAVDDAIVNEQHPQWGTTLAAIQADADYSFEFQKSFQDGLVSQENIDKAIASFIRIMISKDSKFDLSLRGQATLSAIEEEGLNQIFLTEQGDCFHCHGVYPFMTDNDFHDNGLQDVLTIGDYVDQGLGGFSMQDFDIGKMKAPSLRNLSYTAPYMHDGRFATLDEVIDFYSEGVHQTPNVDPLMKQVAQGGLQLDAQQKAALKAFLLTLDDPTFIENEEYKTPF